MGNKDRRTFGYGHGNGHARRAPRNGHYAATASHAGNEGGSEHAWDQDKLEGYGAGPGAGSPAEDYSKVVPPPMNSLALDLPTPARSSSSERAANVADPEAWTPADAAPGGATKYEQVVGLRGRANSLREPAASYKVEEGGRGRANSLRGPEPWELPDSSSRSTSGPSSSDPVYNGNGGLQLPMQPRAPVMSSYREQLRQSGTEALQRTWARKQQNSSGNFTPKSSVVVPPSPLMTGMQGVPSPCPSPIHNNGMNGMAGPGGMIGMDFMGAQTSPMGSPVPSPMASPMGSPQHMTMSWPLTSPAGGETYWAPSPMSPMAGMEGSPAFWPAGPMEMPPMLPDGSMQGTLTPVMAPENSPQNQQMQLMSIAMPEANFLSMDGYQIQAQLQAAAPEVYED